MLLGFGAKNFCCFKDWLEIDMTFSSAVPVDISNELHFATSMCLKGANASGKTSAIKVLSFLQYFVNDSFNEKPDNKILFDTFFNNKETAEFYVKFKLNDIDYSYELSTTKERVLKESILKKEGRKRSLLEREEEKITKNSLMNNEKKFHVRSNASIISTANQHEIVEIKPIYDFFKSITTNVSYYGMRKNKYDYKMLSKIYKNDKEAFNFVKQKILAFDTGVNDIEIISLKNSKNEEVYSPVFKHLNETDMKSLLFEVQSSGTKALFQYLLDYYYILQHGGILLMDEFDINLHPEILPHLIRLFNNTKDNPKKAQLIFTTHNADIIDEMGKYRTYMFNKENSVSYCYRLDELSSNVIRNDRPISPLYKSKKLGGVPKIKYEKV